MEKGSKTYKLAHKDMGSCWGVFPCFSHLFLNIYNRKAREFCLWFHSSSIVYWNYC
jgi:hypothetical protein